MKNMCPGCGTVYNVTSAHVGRQITCQKCNASLVVDPEGIRLADGTGAQGNDVATSAARRRTRMGNRALQGLWGRITQDVPTFLFGLGAVFIILFLFNPLIDSAKLARVQAALTGGENRLQREIREMRTPEPGKTLSADEMKRIEEEVKKKQEAWDKDKKELTADVEDRRMSNERAKYFYMWGMMLGFLFLAIAALGYLSPRQSTARRVVGSIVICAEVILIFIAFVIPAAIAFNSR